MTGVRTPEPPKPPREPRRLTARDALIATSVAALLLVLVEGTVDPQQRRADGRRAVEGGRARGRQAGRPDRRRDPAARARRRAHRLAVARRRQRRARLLRGDRAGGGDGRAARADHSGILRPACDRRGAARAARARHGARHGRLALDAARRRGRPSARGRRDRGDPRPAGRHGHLARAGGRLGLDLRAAGARGAAGRGRGLHRCERGVPDTRAGRRRRPVLRRGLGSRVRHARPADDGHLPPGWRGARLLADAADAARRGPPGGRAGGERGDRRRRRSPTACTCGYSTWSSCSRPAASTATRWRSTARRRSSASRTGST